MNTLKNRVLRLTQTIYADAAAGLVTFLLGIPLALGAAVASGTSATSGLIAAASGGIVGGGLAGAPMMVTGPVVALAMLTLRAVERFGVVGMCLVTLLAGGIQIILAALRVGRAVLAVDAAILEGMLAGIGVTLALAQMQTICGAMPQPSVWASVLALPQAVAHADWRDLATAAATVGLVMVWNRLRWQRYLPSAVAAIGLVTLGLYALDTVGLRRVVMPPLARQLDIGSLLATLRDATHDVRIFWAATELALVCSVYSLLSAVSVDSLHSGPRAQLNRELLAQGAANVTSGLLGGLAVSGAVLRSTANVTAGARTRWANVCQGVFMVFALTQLKVVLSEVPIACLAAFFVQLGISLVRPRRIRDF